MGTLGIVFSPSSQPDPQVGAGIKLSKLSRDLRPGLDEPPELITTNPQLQVPGFLLQVPGSLLQVPGW